MRNGPSSTHLEDRPAPVATLPRFAAVDEQAFWDQGYLRIPGVFSPAEATELADALDSLMEQWGFEAAWTGPWREQLLGTDMAARIRMRTLHDLQLYSAAWARAVVNPRLIDVVSQLLGPLVEFHFTTMHVKPPETGSPFPMHQDHAFYAHMDDRYVDVLIHLDDTSHENGEIRFLPGSHRSGPLEHIRETPSGPCTPHLPVDQHRLEDTVAVPASRGDIVCFNINTVHGSYLNTTPRARRLVRVGYRHPENRQISGDAFGRPGMMVAGLRPRGATEEPFPLDR